MELIVARIPLSASLGINVGDFSLMSGKSCAVALHSHYDGIHIGAITVTAYTSGPYYVAHSLQGESGEDVIHASGDEEIGARSATEWVRDLNLKLANHH